MTGPTAFHSVRNHLRWRRFHTILRSVTDSLTSVPKIVQVGTLGTLTTLLTTVASPVAGESSADAATSAIARETIDLVTSPQWQQLRACTAPGCAYYFVKQHFRQRWCSAVCGNRARVARHAAQLHHKT
jgi:predicted RNA-binding Zn ribbon-like protein